MAKPKLNIPQDQISLFCRRNHIRKLSLFGSILSDEFSPDSDIDVLVEFEPGHTPGLALIRMQEEFSQILGGREVDMITPKFLNRRIRDKVIEQSLVQYAQE